MSIQVAPIFSWYNVWVFFMDMHAHRLSIHASTFWVTKIDTANTPAPNEQPHRLLFCHTSRSILIFAHGSGNSCLQFDCWHTAPHGPCHVPSLCQHWFLSATLTNLCIIRLYSVTLWLGSLPINMYTSVPFFWKLVNLFFGYFDPVNIFLDNKNK